MPPIGETHLPIKFSLKVLLIAFAGLGVAGGVLGRVFSRDPDVFMSVFSLVSTVVPFLLAIGTIIWIGFRGRQGRSAPICGKCQCDLRWMRPDRMADCPDCGADLAEPGAVLFARVPTRRWGLIAWGGLLLLTPPVGIGMLFVARHFFVQPSFRGVSNLRAATTQQLIQQGLPNRIDEPWVWNELENRLTAGSLSQQEVENAINKLVSHMKTTRPDGWERPLSWQDDFLKSAVRANKVSDAVLFDLCDAFYGPKPIIRPLPRVREDGEPLEIEIEYGNTWGSHAGLGMELLWEVTQVLLDGKPLQLRQSRRQGQRWSGLHEGGLAVGDHELSVEVECAYIDREKLIGLNPDDLPVNRWPKARKRWKQSVSTPLKIYAKDEPVVQLVASPDRDPIKTGGLQIDRFVAQVDRNNQTTTILKFEFAPGLSIPLSCDVAAVFGEQTVQLGRMWVVQDKNSRHSGGSQLQQGIESLAPSLKQADIILTPNPRHIEHRPEVSEIWGRKIILRAVPIERLDLEVGQANGRP